MRQALSQSLRQTGSYRVAAHSAAGAAAAGGGGGGGGGGAHLKAAAGGGGDYPPARVPAPPSGAPQGRGPGSLELIKRAEAHREAARKAEYGYSVVHGQQKGGGGQGGEAFLVSARSHSFLAQQSFLMALNDGLLLDPDAAQRCEVRHCSHTTALRCPFVPLLPKTTSHY